MTRTETREFLAWVAREYPDRLPELADCYTARWLREDLEELA